MNKQTRTAALGRIQKRSDAYVQKYANHSESTEHNDRVSLLTICAELQAENLEPHSKTCQMVVIGSTHCDCHRRRLCDCPDCIRIRNDLRQRPTHHPRCRKLMRDNISSPCTCKVEQMLDNNGGLAP